MEGVSASSSTIGPGDELALTLFWRALDRPDVDYTVFAHLLDGDGNKVAQHDWQPRDAIGLRPATTWRAGESIVDAETLIVPSDLEPGKYRLIVGLYNWQNGNRLPVQGRDAAPENVVNVAEVSVK